jgi:hypothetical protein
VGGEPHIGIWASYEGSPLGIGTVGVYNRRRPATWVRIGNSYIQE